MLLRANSIWSLTSILSVIPRSPCRKKRYEKRYYRFCKQTYDKKCLALFTFALIYAEECIVRLNWLSQLSTN